MRTWNNEAQFCPNPKIIAGRLIAMRNIYLREELRNIAKEIQDHHQERLPVLPLVSLAAYEQIFQRQPLCLPGEHRQDAVRYGLEYYKRHIEKLKTAEADNGLCPAHDRLSSVDKNCPLHQIDSSMPNSNRSKTTDRHSSSSSFADSSDDISLHSSASDTSSQSTTTTRESSSARTFSRRNIPKIMISRTSDSGSRSNDSDTSTTIDDDQTSTDTDTLTVP